jgi:hypothetical protein
MLCKITCISVTWFEIFGRLGRHQNPYIYCIRFQLIHTMHDHIASGLHDPEGNRCIWLLLLLWKLTPIVKVQGSLESGYCSEADVIEYIQSVSENRMRGFTWRQYLAYMPTNICKTSNSKRPPNIYTKKRVIKNSVLAITIVYLKMVVEKTLETSYILYVFQSMENKQYDWAVFFIIQTNKCPHLYINKMFITKELTTFAISNYIKV